VKLALRSLTAALLVVACLLPKSSAFALVIDYKFTSAGAVNINGPIQSALDSAYAGTTLQGLVSESSTAVGIQLWTVPTTGDYRITAVGGAGGNGAYAGGYGAVETATITLTQGTVLQILVGQKGASNSTAGGGGGGSFVVKGSATPLVVAGGGGGGGYSNAGINATNSTSGTNGSPGGLGGSNVGGAYSNAGGCCYAGSGGGSNLGSTGYASGAGLAGTPGAGFGGNGGNGGNSQTGALAFVNGGTGSTYGSTGISSGWGTASGSGGGFGGGGSGTITSGYQAGGGGGGGYAGGGGGNGYEGASNLSAIQAGGGGGGGSYETGTAQASGLNSVKDDGYVFIEFTIPLAATISIANPGVMTYRTSNNLMITSDSPGRVTFFANRKRIPGCVSVLLSSAGSNYSAQCAYKPSLHGTVIVTASISPSDSHLQSTSPPIYIAISARASNR